MAISKIITSSLTDDAVTSAKIGTDQVGADALSSSAISGAVDIPANSVGESELSVDYTAQSVPHIIPGVLQPAVAGKLLNGANHSGAYGTPQTQSGGDGHSYYYTDIKGSKPIKDPRIGAYFGSQRHKFKSLQLLEQETAANEGNVYSIDGREWARAVDVTSGAVTTTNDSIGQKVVVHTDKEGWIEIVGYFNAVNLIMRVQTNKKSLTPYINGTAGSTQTPQEASVTTPLDGRYVDGGSVVSLTLPSTSLGINTLLIKDNIESSHSTNYHYGIELIAQDTTSTANRSKIQIPSQNVVSFGKKFAVSGTPHYNPFATNQAGTAVAIGNTTSHGSVATGWAGTGAGYFDDTLDTATSLGLSAWEQNSKYYRPVNGGRVVKWVDSSGNIKTSVNMMPPTGTSIGVSSATNTPEANNWTTQYQPLFSSTTIDNSQAEVAKTFHFREFGNGNANGGVTGTYKDASMLDTGTNRDIGYVMDDGLTSICGDDVRTDSTRGTIRTDGVNDNYYITFIGTGFSFTNQTGGTTFGGGDDFDFIVDGVVVKSWQSGSTIDEKTTVVQNLPYGTHVFKMLNTAAPASEHMHAKEFTFHQPKRPPIPEDACVIADYMLMADFVPQTSAGGELISKGTRRQNCSRDVFYDETDDHALDFLLNEETAFGFRIDITGAADSDTSFKMRIPSFGTNYVHRGFQSDTRTKLFIGNTDNDSNATKDNTANHGSYAHLTSDLALGVHQFGANAVTGQTGFTNGFDIVTPIHTSSHYQPFETPFLRELVGGDRNMEQTNLVVSPDGKSWDELTRDTSYLGDSSLVYLETHEMTGGTQHIVSTSTVGLFHINMLYKRGEWSGVHAMNKGHFALAYDRLVCLTDGFYLIESVYRMGNNDTSKQLSININKGSERISFFENEPEQYNCVRADARVYLERGEYIQVDNNTEAGVHILLNDPGVNFVRITKL